MSSTHRYTPYDDPNASPDGYHLLPAELRGTAALEPVSQRPRGRRSERRGRGERSSGRDITTWAIVATSAIGALGAAVVATTAFTTSLPQLGSSPSNLSTLPRVMDEQSSPGQGPGSSGPSAQPGTPQQPTQASPGATQPGVDRTQAARDGASPAGSEARPSTRPVHPRDPSSPSNRPDKSNKPGHNGSSNSGSRNPGTGVGDQMARDLLDSINRERANAGLNPLVMDTDLVDAAEAHNQQMAAGCGMEHQCPSEASLGDRLSQQGAQWSSAGENIGVGGPVEMTDQAAFGMGQSLTDSMFAERPPNDGHRQNLLSSSFTRVGIHLLRDSQNQIWMTQDFAG